MFQKAGHGPQVLTDVAKELSISLAEIVKPRFTVAGSLEAILGATALAGSKNWSAMELISTEAPPRY